MTSRKNELSDRLGVSSVSSESYASMEDKKTQKKNIQINKIFHSAVYRLLLQSLVRTSTAYTEDFEGLPNIVA